ncbi:MAG: S-methyl-5-thioribose-1-phosphate isomerase [Eubacteriales bacterium]|nr:S-methyl-5-thioribose-1-phosphate isomerase [Eubacteriales bacterium]
MNALNLDTVLMSEDRKFLKILDQTKLPGTIEVLELDKLEDIWHAINILQVRGAPAIGVCAAYALALAASQIDIQAIGTVRDTNRGIGAEEIGITDTSSEEAKVSEFLRLLREKRDYLATARPTAVNLFWALDRMMNVAENAAGTALSVPCIKELLFREADAIREEDIAISRNIGEIGYKLICDINEKKKRATSSSNNTDAADFSVGILTHCNAGTLATAKYGTATAPMYIALEHGMQDFRVYCDETRPLLQGARLTAFEMHSAGIDTTLICDNMASYMMKQGKIDIIFVGCDRVARNGDAANKIGTSGVAILAKHYGIPFYVCAPSSTIDMSIASGDEIPIEQRKPEEVTEMWYKERMAPEGVKVCNPAFDVTDHSLITGIITEKGLWGCHGDGSFDTFFNCKC